MRSSRASVFFLAAAVTILAGCSDGQTYGFDDSGSYTGAGVFSLGAASGAPSGTSEGSVTPMPEATLAFDGNGALTVWPSCSISVTKTGTESTQDTHDTGVRKANGNDFQETDTYEQAYDFTIAANQSCAVGPAGDSHGYTFGSGSMRFTIDGHAAGDFGGASSSGATFVYSFDGDHV